MSKKRKTRKQKESARMRHTHQIMLEKSETPLYTVTGITKGSIKKKTISSIKIKSSILSSDLSYLKQDITSITAASGIILAFDAALLILLTTGALRLNFLGY